MHARAQAQGHIPCKHSELSALMVAMPTTPGQGDLDGVQKEVDSIVGAFKKAGSVKIDALSRPTADVILEKLEGYSIIHFACHGISTENPADSHLVLSKPCTTPFLNGVYIKEADKLCVRDIAAKRLQSGSFPHVVQHTIKRIIWPMRQYTWRAHSKLQVSSMSLEHYGQQMIMLA